MTLDDDRVRTTPSHAERARTLVASGSEGALSTIARDPEGHPFGSHVIYACVAERPVFLISRLAEHTKNLEADDRASLLVLEGGARGADSLMLGRVTLLGSCRRVVDRAEVEGPFLDQHPAARAYASFSDFAFYALRVASVRYVGGFGRMSWITEQAFREAEPDPLRDMSRDIARHMNEDHADACLSYAQAHAGIEAPRSARIVAVDRYGFDLHVDAPAGTSTVRIAFDAPVATAEEVRRALVTMARAARAKLAG